MKLEKIFLDPSGIEWRVAGYSNPRQKGAGVYRLIRMTDGSRIRVKSNKLYWLEVSNQTLYNIMHTPENTNESVSGGGSKPIESDWEKVGFQP